VPNPGFRPEQLAGEHYLVTKGGSLSAEIRFTSVVTATTAAPGLPFRGVMFVSGYDAWRCHASC
jgi:hypothetical protein